MRRAMKPKQLAWQAVELLRGDVGQVLVCVRGHCFGVPKVLQCAKHCWVSSTQTYCTCTQAAGRVNTVLYSHVCVVSPRRVCKAVDQLGWEWVSPSREAGKSMFARTPEETMKMRPCVLFRAINACTALRNAQGLAELFCGQYGSLGQLIERQRHVAAAGGAKE